MIKFLKILSYTIAILLIVAILISRLGYYLVTSKIPEFLNTLTEEARRDVAVQSKIGDFKSYEYNYNENDLKKDTLKFQIKVKGVDSTLVIEGFALKQNKEWLPAKMNSHYSKE